MYAILLLTVFIITAEARESCQERRERESQSSDPMRLIPECDEQGNYKPRQCFEDSELCVCYNKTGHPVTQPSEEIKFCDCLVLKHDNIQTGFAGAFIPQCYEDGRFEELQCVASTGVCFCVDPETGDRTTIPQMAIPDC